MLSCLNIFSTYLQMHVFCWMICLLQICEKVKSCYSLSKVCCLEYKVLVKLGKNFVLWYLHVI
jgi:hypothetical protein